MAFLNEFFVIDLGLWRELIRGRSGGDEACYLNQYPLYHGVICEGR